MFDSTQEFNHRILLNDEFVQFIRNVNMLCKCLVYIQEICFWIFVAHIPLQQCWLSVHQILRIFTTSCKIQSFYIKINLSFMISFDANLWWCHLTRSVNQLEFSMVWKFSCGCIGILDLSSLLRIPFQWSKQSLLVKWSVNITRIIW